MDRKWIALLFKCFSEIYLGKWSDKFPTPQLMEAHMRQWSLGLNGLTWLQINQGIDRCRVHAAWPPEISEFVAYAKEGESFIHQSNANKIWQALPSPKCDRAQAISAIQQIKQCLR
jgi:hypothetical protein